MRRSSLLLAALGLFLVPAPAEACTISATGVAFGAYSPSSATPRTGVGSISLDCHPSSTPVISLGTGNSGTYAQRRMSNGSSNLGYNLFTAASMTVVWGNGSGGTQAVSAPKKTSTTTIYGRIPAGQNVSAGTYSDTLIVTLVF